MSPKQSGDSPGPSKPTKRRARPMRKDFSIWEKLRMVKGHSSCRRSSRDSRSSLSTSLVVFCNEHFDHPCRRLSHEENRRPINSQQRPIHYSVTTRKNHRPSHFSEVLMAEDEGTGRGKGGRASHLYERLNIKMHKGIHSAK